MTAREDSLSSWCISLLEEVKILLENQGSTGNILNKNNSQSHGLNASVPNVSRQATTNNSNPTTSARVQESNLASSTSTLSELKPEHQPERVIENCRSLFSPYGSSTRSPWFHPPPGKKPKKGYFQVKETWTHEFLSSQHYCGTRAFSHGKNEASECGLGWKKVVFSCKANALEVQQVVEGIYPKLADLSFLEVVLPEHHWY